LRCTGFLVDIVASTYNKRCARVLLKIKIEIKAGISIKRSGDLYREVGIAGCSAHLDIEFLSYVEIIKIKKCGLKTAPNALTALL
jgi:hypothetical protein